MANERTPAEIQKEIEQARVQLASSLDQLAERTSPKRLAVQTKDNLVTQATSPQGKKALAIGAAVIIGLVVLKRMRSRNS